MVRYREEDVLDGDPQRDYRVLVYTESENTQRAEGLDCTLKHDYTVLQGFWTS